MSNGGKGSAARPIGVDKETFSNNWDSIFGKKKEKTKEFVSDVSQCTSINETFAFMVDKNRLSLFAIDIKDTDMVYLVNAKNHEEAIDIIIGNGYQGFSENVNDYNFIRLADARPFVTEAGLELYKDNIAIMVVSQLPKFTYENDKNICGLNFEFKYSSINQTNLVFNPKQMVWYYKGSGVNRDKWLIKATNSNRFQSKEEKQQIINNIDFINDTTGWKSDGKTHVTNTDVYHSNYNSDLYLYLVKEVTKEVFDTSPLITIAAKDDFDAISFYPGYGNHEGKEYQSIVIGKALPTIPEGIVSF